ncbi:MAG: hypothetical protein WB947_04480 [Thermoplasmata archaeon]
MVALIAVILIAVVPAAVATSSSKVQPNPSRRWGPNIVYDAKDGYLLMFGGSSGGNTTWKFADGKWIDLNIAIAPPRRAHAGIAYDAADGYVVLFGGTNPHFLNDTWEYSGGHWTNVTASAGRAPSSRTTMGMTDDAKDGYVLLFGGINPRHQTQNDTWEFAHGRWTNVTGTTGATPLTRFAEGMAYDATNEYVVMYGGWTDAKNQKDKTLDDTWKFTAGRWTELQSASGPGPRWFVGMTFDSEDGYILMFEGIIDAGVKSNWNTPPDTWTFAGGVWTNVTNASDTPSHRFAEGLADDPAGGYVLMFGGLNSTAMVAHSLGDTWTYTNKVWSNISKTA